MSELEFKSNLDKAVRKLLALEAKYPEDPRDAVIDLGKELPGRIEKTASRRGLGDKADFNEKPDQPSLTDSFSFQKGVGKVIVTSNAPHAAAHERKAPHPHPIPLDGTQVTFYPENVSEYSGTGYPNGDGSVTIPTSRSPVQHPGVEGVNYISDTLDSFVDEAHEKAGRERHTAIISSGFRKHG